MQDYMLAFFREVALPILHLGGLSLVVTFAAKMLVKAWKENKTATIWGCLWTIAICISSAFRGGVL